MSEELTPGAGAPAGDGAYVLSLYVAGNSPQSSRAITNIKSICESHLPGRHALTIVDLYGNLEGGLADRIVVLPTLIRHAPLPVRRLIGDMSKTERVLADLDLPPDPAT